MTGSLHDKLDAVRTHVKCLRELTYERLRIGSVVPYAPPKRLVPVLIKNTSLMLSFGDVDSAVVHGNHSSVPQ